MCQPCSVSAAHRHHRTALAGALEPAIGRLEPDFGRGWNQARRHGTSAVDRLRHLIVNLNSGRSTTKPATVDCSLRCGQWTMGNDQFGAPDGFLSTSLPW